MNDTYLYMVMLGCTPKGRNTEQHDIFFGINNTLKGLVPNMNDFWPEAKGKLHIDAWQKITFCDGYNIEIAPKSKHDESQKEKLFFLNLGGYKENEFEEYHYKVLTVANSKAEAIKKAKQSSFYKHYDFKGAASHIDDKYGIDVDDIHEIEDILLPEFKNQYKLKLTKNSNLKEDIKHIGYLKIDKIKS